jgi:hypothetical protein
VPNSQASNIFIARSQLGASFSATMMSSIMCDLAGQSSARAENPAKDKTTVGAARQGLKRIACSSICLILVPGNSNTVQERPIVQP